MLLENGGYEVPEATERDEASSCSGPIPRTPPFSISDGK
jgi:hypothetical protein